MHKDTKTSRIFPETLPIQLLGNYTDAAIILSYYPAAVQYHAQSSLTVDMDASLHTDRYFHYK